MSNIMETLDTVSTIGGYKGSCVADSDSGMMLASHGGGIDLELAAAGNTEVVRAKRTTMASLQLDDAIEDILITLHSQYHLIRPLRANGALFIYVVLDKAKANLAMARLTLAKAEESLELD